MHHCASFCFESQITIVSPNDRTYTSHLGTCSSLALGVEQHAISLATRPSNLSFLALAVKAQLSYRKLIHRYHRTKPSVGSPVALILKLWFNKYCAKRTVQNASSTATIYCEQCRVPSSERVQISTETPEIHTRPWWKASSGRLSPSRILACHHTLPSICSMLDQVPDWAITPWLYWAMLPGCHWWRGPLHRPHSVDLSCGPTWCSCAFNISDWRVWADREIDRVSREKEKADNERRKAHSKI